MTKDILMERYIRNIQIPQIGEEGQKKLLCAKVLIAGAGGLGSTVIALLASAGVGKLGIIDSDLIEITNLNRQFLHKTGDIGKEKSISAEKFVHELNPDIKVEAYQIRLNEQNYSEIIEKYEIIVDCFDNLESKFLLNKIALASKKPLIHGGVSEFGGQVTTVIPYETVCLSCLFGNIPETEKTKGVISPAVSTIASIQAMEVVKLITNTGCLLKNRILFYDGFGMTFKELNTAKNPHCPLCK